MTPTCILINFCVNIAATVFMNCSSSIGNKTKSDIEKELDRYFKINSSHEALVVIENYDIFKSFLNLPQVHDTFLLYINYKVRGSNYSELINRLKLPADKLYVSESTIIDYLTKSFRDLCAEEFSDIDNYDWSAIWRHLMDAITSVTMDSFTAQDTLKLAFTHDRIDKSTDLIAKILKKEASMLLNHIQRMFECHLTIPDENFDTTRTQYKTILNRKFNSAHIYLLGYVVNKHLTKQQCIESAQQQGMTSCFLHNE